MLRLVLATNVPYTRYHGGANRSNRALVEALTARGHAVSVVTPALASPPMETYPEWRNRRVEEGAVLEPTAFGERFRARGVDVHAVVDQSRMIAALAETIAREKPDRILVASEDPSQSLLAAALDAAPDRVVYLALTPQLFPFGPESLYPGEERADLVRRCRLRLVLSRAAAEYVERWAGVSAEIYTPPHFGEGPFPTLADPAGPALLMNASDIKGIAIFRALAEAFPERRFAALPGYATTADDRGLLASLPNVEIRANRPSLDDVLAGVGVVLMPSLWMESFGMAAVDAMLRGIPVLASNHGALPEALCGTREPLPVRPIEGYRDTLRDNLLLEPIIPEQDVGPWRDALAELWADPTAYAATSRRVAEAARAFAASASVEPVERLLMADAPASPQPAAKAADAAPAGNHAMTPEQKAEALRRMRARRSQSGGAPAAPSGIPKVSRTGDLPLSPGQRRLYFLQRLAPTSGTYNTAFGLRLKGALDRDALARALDGLAARHESLRITIVEQGGEPVARIAEPAGLPLETFAAANEADALATLRARAARRFDLARGPLARAHLATIAPDDHVLLVAIHHIATDARSTGIILRDLGAFYAAARDGRAPEPASERIDFADWVLWQADPERVAAARKDEDYWVGELAGAPEAINLPLDRPRPAVRKNTGDSLDIGFGAALTERVARLARERGATLFMTMLASWAVVLHRLGGDEDMVVGVPVANRPRAELEDIVGFFVDTLPLRLRVAQNPTFDALLGEVREKVVDGFEHAGAAFERIVERLDLPRVRSHAPVVQTLFGLHNAPDDALALAGLEATPVPLHNGTAKFDLNVELAEVDGRLEGSIEYDIELFQRATMERLVEAWRTVLEGLVEDPRRRIGAVPLLPPMRIAEIHARLNPPPAPLDPSDSIAAHLRAAAARAPDAEALRWRGATMSYGELDRVTDRLAAGLVARGVGPDVSVAFATERGFDRMIAMLGILKAGGACVPLDLGLPAERLRYILANSKAPFVLAHEPTRAKVETLGEPVLALADVVAGPGAPLPERVPHDATAYILYTSGSTGVPKGVAYPHGAELNLMLWFVERLPEPARALQFASIGFDASFNESLSVLMSGGALDLLDETERADITRAVDVYLERGIERAVVSVVLLNLLAERILQRPPETLALREIMATGEQLKITPAVEALLARHPQIRLWNDYGPTESNVVTALDVTARADHYGALPPIGRPVRASRCYVLDRYLHVVPEGMPGQLFLAGTALARGYNSEPGMTAASFVPDPFAETPGERMYRSGDIARLRADGELELIGRADDQLKIRGFRVEPAEVEIALRAHPSVGDCLVIARVFPGDDRRLVAYVVAGAGGPKPDVATLRAHLAERLPDYMVPAHIVLLPHFELNTNGKIDRTRLPLPQAEETAGEDLLAPRTEFEQILLELWRDVLDVRAIDIRDDFFSLGGHSLLIIRIIAKLRERLGVDLPLATFMDGPTIEDVAVAVTALMASGGDEDDLEALLAEIEGDTVPAAARDTLDAEALRRVLVERAMSARPGPGVAAIGIPSSNRPDVLAGCLASYLENARDHGHRPEVVVCGRQRDAATDAAYRRVLEEAGERYGLAVSYAGAVETDAFADRLAAKAGVDPAVVRFALADTEGVGAAYGVGRNALLLHNAGRAFVGVDDDTRAAMRMRVEPGAGLALRSEPGVSEIRVMADRAAALAAAQAVPVDWLGTHAAHLGADVAALFAGDPQRPLDTEGAARDAFARLASGEGRIVGTYHGWCGDSGWAGGEEARWLTGVSFDLATASADHYARALQSREILRDVPGLTLSRGGDFYCLSAGFDARLPLVPFLPVQRREDAFFGWLAMLADPAAVAAHLPGMVLHDAPPRDGTPPIADPIDLAALLRAALVAADDLPDAAEERLSRLGAHLRRAAERDDFDGWLRERALVEAGRELGEVEARIAACAPEKAFWARDAEVAVGLARAALARPDSHLPRALGPDLDAPARAVRVRRIAALYGGLLEAWPTLMKAAAELRESGTPLAHPLGRRGAS